MDSELKKYSPSRLVDVLEISVVFPLRCAACWSHYNYDSDRGISQQAGLYMDEHVDH